jgi:hypothetical protein
MNPAVTTIHIPKGSILYHTGPIYDTIYATIDQFWGNKDKCALILNRDIVVLVVLKPSYGIKQVKSSLPDLFNAKFGTSHTDQLVCKHLCKDKSQIHNLYNELLENYDGIYNTVDDGAMCEIVLKSNMVTCQPVDDSCKITDQSVRRAVKKWKLDIGPEWDNF